MSLNHDVLKRTQGLLAEIDRVVAAPTLAERVSRVIESAAPSVWASTWDDPDDWFHDHNVSRLGGPCGCPSDDGDYCSDAYIEKVNPIAFVNAPYIYGSRGSAAPYGCGAEGCACVDLFEQPGPTSSGPYFSAKTEVIREMLQAEWRGAQREIAASMSRYRAMRQGPTVTFAVQDEIRYTRQEEIGPTGPAIQTTEVPAEVAELLQGRLFGSRQQFLRDWVVGDEEARQRLVRRLRQNDRISRMLAERAPDRLTGCQP